jgi:hypothetical protein
MLKNTYDEILVGMNLVSLIRGIISTQRDRSVLLINDPRFLSENSHLNFISELEILGLLRLGATYDIPELLSIRQFLRPAQMNFMCDSFYFKFSSTPFENLHEILRKFPELVDKNDLDRIFEQDEGEFNQYINQEIKRYENFAFETRLKTKNNLFTFEGPDWFLSLYKLFCELINEDFSVSKNLKFSTLLHFLGISFEEKMKTQLGGEELPFYFLRLFSPVYRLEDFFLGNQLKRRFLKCGGDYKESLIQYWQLVENKFENLLLASFEGVISGERVLFFSHLPLDVPFEIACPFAFYRKTKLSPMVNSQKKSRPEKITFLTEEALLGTERPFRTFLFDKTIQSYELPFLDLPGTKPEFYNHQLLKSYEHDSKKIPTDYVEALVAPSFGVTLDMRSFRRPFHSSSVLTPIPVEITQNEKNIAGFEYWGALKFKSLGFLSMCYGVEGL